MQILSVCKSCTLCGTQPLGLYQLKQVNQLLSNFIESSPRNDINGELAGIFIGTIEIKDPNLSIIVRWAETQLQTGKWQCGYF